jgi:hypothetical protein
VLDEVQAREHLPRPAHERLQQRELLGRQLDLDAVAPHLPGRGVQAERADLQHRGPLHHATAGERPQPRQQLRERERLGQVVVGAAVQAGDPVLDAVARGQDEDRRPDPAVPQLTADVEAAEAREHHVQHDRVVGDRLRHPEGVLARPGDVGGVALLDQPPPDEGRHLQLVLDDQRAHAHIVGLPNERVMRAA